MTKVNDSAPGKCVEIHITHTITTGQMLETAKEIHCNCSSQEAGCSWGHTKK